MCGRALRQGQARSRLEVTARCDGEVGEVCNRRSVDRHASASMSSAMQYQISTAKEGDVCSSQRETNVRCTLAAENTTRLTFTVPYVSYATSPSLLINDAPANNINVADCRLQRSATMTVIRIDFSVLTSDALC